MRNSLLYSKGITFSRLPSTLFLSNWMIYGMLVLTLAFAGLIYRHRIKSAATIRLIKQNQRAANFNKLLKEEKKGLLAENEILVTENEWLLNEVHHRVKNNLQIIVSLLDSQASFLKGDALSAIKESHHRVFALALIHKQIYVEGSTQHTDFSKFLTELGQYLIESYPECNQISLNYDLEKIRVAHTKAISLAIIANEILTNSLQHAFLPGDTGSINISLHEIKGRVALSISDNGTGTNINLNQAKSDSLGINLVQGLAKDIDSEINIRSDMGTEFIIFFDSSCPNESKKIIRGMPVLMH
ncbi:sensor histidine kinase [Pedobacter sp. Leaf194]|uniref:sensor histidine kinase n=1 Tax=Pedobacter sp. Leaf194 TaxID=1736297 RepID=UPI00138ED29D|nr:sensor histidine kinase [Pedobacter sp. Leaf194]